MVLGRLWLVCLFLLSPPALAAEQYYSPAAQTQAVLALSDGFANQQAFFGESVLAFTYDAATRTFSNLKFAINAQSLSGPPQLLAELKQPNELDTAQYPEISFRQFKPVALDAQNQAMIAGELTLRGQTQPLTLQLRLNRAESAGPHTNFWGTALPTLGLTLNGSVDRTQYQLGNKYAADRWQKLMVLRLDAQAINN